MRPETISRKSLDAMIGRLLLENSRRYV